MHSANADALLDARIDGKRIHLDHGHRLSVAVAQKLFFQHLGNCIHALQKAQCIELLLRNLKVLSLTASILMSDRIDRKKNARGPPIH